MALTEDHVREELKKVIDPELFVNIVDLGLIYDVNFEPNEEDDSKQDLAYINLLLRKRLGKIRLLVKELSCQ